MLPILSPIHRRYVCRNLSRTFDDHLFQSEQASLPEYIHLRDAVVNDGNTTNVGRLTIMPSSYTGSQRHIHEHGQGAIVYVRHYGRPDLVITLT